MPRAQKSPSQFPPSPKPKFLEAPPTDSPPQLGPEPGGCAQPVTKGVGPTPVPTFCPLALKGAMTTPGCLSRKVRTWVHAQCMRACVCVCAHCYPALRSAALYSNWWLGRYLKSPLLCHKASPGPEGPGNRAVGEGQGKDHPPSPAVTHSCTRRKPFDLHPVAGGVNGKGSQEVGKS